MTVVVACALALLPAVSGPLLAQEALLASVNPNGTAVSSSTIAPEQSVDLTSDLNPPLPVATDTTDEAPVQNPLVDSGIPRRFHYELRLNIRSVYDDNINIASGQQTADVYTAIEPSIMLGFGDFTSGEGNFLRLNYLASWFLFADHSENDALQHVLQLQGQYQMNRLTLNLTQSVQILDGTDVRSLNSGGTFDQQVNLDVSGRTRFNIYLTHLNAAYYLTGKTSLSAGADYSAYDYHSLISSEVFSGNLFLNYNYSPKLVIGVGGTVGIDRVDAPNPDQTFEQANVRLSYQATGKIDVAASAGVEFRHFDGDLRDQYTSPVFEIGVNYFPFDGTRMSLTAIRRTLNSAVLASQDYAVTNVSVAIQQRLLRRFTVGFNVGYENSEYFSTVGAAGPSRNDDYFFVQPSIAVSVTRFWTVGAYYLHRVNSSSFDAFDFHDNQVGLRSTLEF
ncbi:MAG: outer membrane beta-barrel protein [Verrucomicrobiaceae bacterium]|nr:outer membrane beta-barrel protein [Verrucomicrobiaceae bacterium]